MKCRRCKKSLKGGKASAAAALRAGLAAVEKLGKSTNESEASYAYRFGALHAAARVTLAQLEGFCGPCAHLHSSQQFVEST